jgi:hypothetical protein
MRYEDRMRDFGVLKAVEQDQERDLGLVVLVVLVYKYKYVQVENYDDGNDDNRKIL